MDGRKRALLKGGVVIGALAVCAVGLARPSGAQEPVRLLQTVEVELAADGSIPVMRVVNLQQEQGADEQDKQERGIDPSATASKLPVAISTSYVADGKPGTDLGALAGRQGKVDLSFSVVNTTGRTETIEAVDRLGGARIETQAVVTTPMTVILTAVLPKDARAQIDTSETDGVVSVQGDDTVVQWGAVLAPPAVPGSAQFRLVADFQEFKVRSMTMTVEPGVSSDFSLDRVIDEVFGPAGQSADAQTRQVTRTIDAELESVSADLAAIERAITTAAVSKGQELIRSLDAATDDLKGQIESLRGQVNSLTAFESEASGLLTSADAALVSSIQAVLTDIGINENGTEIRQTGAEPETVLQVVRAIQRDLNGGADVPSSLANRLRALIGTNELVGACPPASAALRCQIKALSTQLDELQRDQLDFASESVDEPAANVEETLSDAKAAASSANGQVAAAVADIASARAKLLDADTSDADALTALDALEDDLILASTSVASLAVELDGIVADLGAGGLRDDLFLADGGAVDSVAESVDAAQTALGDVETKLDTVLDDLCALSPLAQAELASVYEDIDDGAACGDGFDDTDDDLVELLGEVDLVDLDDRLVAAATGYDAAVTALSGLADDADDLSTAVNTVIADIGAISAEVESGQLSAQEADVLLGNSQVALATAATALATTDAEITDATTEFTNLIAGLKNGLEGLKELLSATIRSNVKAWDETAAKTLAESIRRIESASALLGSESEAKLRAIQEDLVASRALNTATIERIKDEITTTLDALVDSAGTSLDATRTRLEGSTNAVFTNLTGTASPNLSQQGLAGGGFQGQLREQVSNINTEASQAEQIGDSADQLGGLRRSTYIARLIRSVQQERGLDRLAGEQQPFDGETAPGSTVGNIFVYSFEKVG